MLRWAARAGRRKVIFAPARVLSVAAEESFLSGANSVYAEQMYDSWKADPTSVHASWASYFENIEAGMPAANAFTLPPSLQVGQTKASASAGVTSTDATRCLHMINAFQENGHKLASLDPLGLRGGGMFRSNEMGELDPSFYGFTEADMDRPLQLDGGFGLENVTGIMKNADINMDGQTTLRELYDFLKMTYCAKVGYEYSHLSNVEKKNFIRSKVEIVQPVPSKDHTMMMLERLAKAERFESFLATKFNTAKRFGLEGCDSMIPGIMELVDTSVEQGITEVVIGMPHRGRLNVLANVVNKPLEVIFQEFQGIRTEDDDYSGSGDVKYHLGTSSDRVYPDGKSVHVSLLPNPSHLETVDPVVVGKARAKMDALRDTDGSRVMPVIIHGDAAFAGQGVVYETMQMARLRHYQTGGTIHVICNNQVGFTCDPSDARSTPYASDLGKGFQCPIFHVNADDPDEVCRVFRLAAEYRNEFHTDIVIDLIGYRKFGHNELDQPLYTQPEMYSIIKSQKSSLDLYVDSLLSAQRVSKAEIDEVVKSVESEIEGAFNGSKDYFYSKGQTWLDRSWGSMRKPGEKIAFIDHSASRELIDKVSPFLTRLPENFTLHNSLKRTFKQREGQLASGEAMDWGTCEALAFGTLIAEGYGVRLSGQDCERGTFSHRHCVVHDQKSHDKHCFIQSMGAELEGSGSFHVANSLLSEYGAMGFDLGYSMEDPDNLVLWEAQFGDFVNGAQIMIDQYLAAMESKWLRQTGLVLLLPHGYQGMGPEHSSARIERFLQLTDEDPDHIMFSDLSSVTPEDRQVQLSQCNWQVVNPSTPAQYFHCLRRQIHRQFRKPLIVASTKALLRHKVAVSSVEDISEGTKFKRILEETESDSLVAPDKMRRVVFCSGKLYYELLEKRQKSEIDDVALIRLEQLSPFPFDHVFRQIAKYSPDAEIVWAQEEPKNQGAWTYVKHRLPAIMNELDSSRVCSYVGRRTMASTAEGYGDVHEREQSRIVEEALGKRQ